MKNNMAMVALLPPMTLTFYIVAFIAVAIMVHNANRKAVTK